MLSNHNRSCLLLNALNLIRPQCIGHVYHVCQVNWHVRRPCHDTLTRGWKDERLGQCSLYSTHHTTIIWSHIAQFSNSPSSVRPERTEQSKGFCLKIKVFCLKIKLFWKNKSIVLKIKVLSIKIKVYYPKDTQYFKATRTKKLIIHKFN